MTVLVVTPPAPVLDRALAKQHLRVTTGDEDALIDAYIAAACGMIDGPDGWLERSIGEQVLELRTDRFCDSLRLPCGPVREIDAVEYVDADGALTALDSDVYVLRGDRLELAYDEAWPSVRGDADGVRIRYVAGFEDGAVPAPITAALLLMVGDLYENRETGVVGTVSAEVKMSTTVEALLRPYRIWR